MPVVLQLSVAQKFSNEPLLYGMVRPPLRASPRYPRAVLDGSIFRVLAPPHKGSTPRPAGGIQLDAGGALRVHDLRRCPSLHQPRVCSAPPPTPSSSGRRVTGSLTERICCRPLHVCFVDTRQCAMCTTRKTRRWHPSCGCFTCPKVSTFSTPFLSSFGESGCSSQRCTFTTTSPSSW